MAKTKKRANTKGAPKKAAPKKAKPSNKPAAKEKRATARKPINRSEFAPLSVSRCTLDLRENASNKLVELKHAGPNGAGLMISTTRDRRTVEEQFEADMARAAAKPKRFRFRDAITGLFVRARDALRRKRTTVRERVK